MSEKEKPLPRPPKTPFERGRSGEKEEDAPLMADKMASAMAEGKLDEFMKEEMPDNEYARSLAAMMMGMTGMLPPGAFPSSSGSGAEEHSAKTEEAKLPEETPSPVQPPEDVINAIHSGDVKGVMEVLAREHRKRMPEEASSPMEIEKKNDTPGLSDVEQETLGRLVKIASENRVSVDWMVLRALKLYINEYQKTGRL